MKKIVALLLVAVMVLSCLPVLAGSNTAQTKEKLDPNIKATTLKFDKTSFDRNKEGDKVTLSYTLEGGKGDGYRFRVYGTWMAEDGYVTDEEFADVEFTDGSDSLTRIPGYIL